MQSLEYPVTRKRDHVDTYHGVAVPNALFVRDLSKGESGFLPLVADIGDDTFGVIDNVGGKLLVVTNREAPNRRVVLIDPAQPGEASWTTVLPAPARPPGSEAVHEQRRDLNA